jgi:hypothetical protein
MKFEQPDKPKTETALAADSKEKRAGKKNKKKSVLKPASLKVTDKKPSEPKSLRDTWEELITSKKKELEEEAPVKHTHEKPNKNKNKENKLEPSKETDEDKRPESTAEQPEDTGQIYEEFEIPLGENTEVEILLYPDSDEPYEVIKNDSQEEEDIAPDPAQTTRHKPAQAKPTITTLSPTESARELADTVQGETSGLEPELELKTTPTEPELSQATTVAATSLSVEEINSQILEAYQSGPSIDRNTEFIEAVGMPVYGAGAPPRIETSPSRGIYNSKNTSPIEDFDEQSQKRKVKKLKTEQKHQAKKIHNLEKTQHEFLSANTSDQTGAEYWRHKIDTSPAMHKAPEPSHSNVLTTAGHEQLLPPPMPLPPEKVSPKLEEKEEGLQLPPEHRLESSAWHNIEVDKKTGHAAEQPAVITYGEAFKREQRQETLMPDEPSEVAAASGQLAVDTIADIGTMPIPQNNQTIKKRTSLNAVENTVRLGQSMSNAGTLWLWLVLGFIIIAIIATAH